jgi:hypothetical protein
LPPSIALAQLLAGAPHGMPNCSCSNMISVSCRFAFAAKGRPKFVQAAVAGTSTRRGHFRLTFLAREMVCRCRLPCAPAASWAKGGASPPLRSGNGRGSLQRRQLGGGTHAGARRPASRSGIIAACGPPTAHAPTRARSCLGILRWTAPSRGSVRRSADQGREGRSHTCSRRSPRAPRRDNRG